MGWKWAPIGGLQYRTHMQAPKYNVHLRRYAVAVVVAVAAVAVAVGRGKLKNVR